MAQISAEKCKEIQKMAMSDMAIAVTKCQVHKIDFTQK